MFTFGYQTEKEPHVIYRVVSKEGFMHDAVPITIPQGVMMHDFAITERYAIFMDLPLVVNAKVWMHPKNSFHRNWILFSVASPFSAVAILLS